MVVLSLKEALSNPETLHRLKTQPETFQFHEDVNLIIGVIHSPPDSFVYDNPDGNGFTASGPFMNVVELLANSLNFTYTYVQAPDGVWGAVMPNGSWTGLVRMVVEEEADLVAATMCVSSSRSKVVDYARTILSNQGQIVVKSGSPRINPWAFALPLTPNVWFGLLLALFLMVITMVLMDQKRSNSNYIVEILRSLFDFSALALNQGLNLKTERMLWKRFMLGAWMSLVTVVFWSYNCSLISLLSARHYKRNIQSLELLTQDPSMSLFVEADTTFYSFIEEATFGVFLAAKKLREEGRLIYLPNPKLPWGFENLVKGGTHGFMTDDGLINQYIVNHFSKTGRCDFYVAREDVVSLNCGIIAKKGNPILEPINHRIGNLEGSGLYQHWRESIVPNSTSCKNLPSKIIVQEAFALSTIWGMLIIYFSGMAVAAITFFMEIMVGKFWE